MEIKLFRQILTYDILEPQRRYVTCSHRDIAEKITHVALNNNDSLTKNIRSDTLLIVI
jgi:hypothetical protein